MFIFRLGVLEDRKKFFNNKTLSELGLDCDGDIMYVYKGKCFRVVQFTGKDKKNNKVYFVNEMHGEFRRMYYPQQYLTLSSKHWLKMIQKDFGLEIDGEMDFYTYNAIMHIYEYGDTLNTQDYYQSFGFIREKDLRKSMHRYYMKQTLKNGINNILKRIV